MILFNNQLWVLIIFSQNPLGQIKTNYVKLNPPIEYKNESNTRTFGSGKQGPNASRSSGSSATACW